MEKYLRERVMFNKNVSKYKLKPPVLEIFEGTEEEADKDRVYWIREGASSVKYFRLEECVLVK